MKRNTLVSIMFLILFYISLQMLLQRLDNFLDVLQDILNIFEIILIGIGIAFVLKNPYNFFSRFYKKLMSPKWERVTKLMSLITVYALFIGVIFTAITLIIPQIFRSFKLIYDNIGITISNLDKLMMEYSKNINMDDINLFGLEEKIKEIPDKLGEISTSAIPRFFVFTSGIVRKIVNISIGFVLSIYCLIEKDKVKKQGFDILHAYVPKKHINRIIKVFHIVNKTFTKFIAGQLLEATILGTLCFIGMIIFDFNYPVLISVIIGLTSLIPVVGAILGLIPALLILVMVDPMKALWFLVFIFLLQQVEGDFIYPKVVGESIGLPALWVLISIIVGGELFGVLGMLLGVPIASVIYQLLREDVNFKLKEDK
ncbi:MAG: AI-2E family transporter [Eubacteriales bacterium]